MPPNVVFRHEIPKALIINENNLDQSLIRTYGVGGFSKTVEEDKWVILTPNINPENLKKHLFNVGILYPESALGPQGGNIPQPGFVIAEEEEEEAETPKKT